VAEEVFTLRVKCIKCGKEWTKSSTIKNGSDEYSGSLCGSCFIKRISPIIHKKQLDEGNFDCFGKANGYCDQSYCKYREWCLRIKQTSEYLFYQSRQLSQSSAQT